LPMANSVRLPATCAMRRARHVAHASNRRSRSVDC
jgi:hypothetical protein